MIIGIKKGDAADSSGGNDDLETSVNDLSLNDLSSTITPLLLIRSMIRSPRNILELLPPGRFGPKGIIHVYMQHTCMYIHSKIILIPIL